MVNHAAKSRVVSRGCLCMEILRVVVNLGDIIRSPRVRGRHSEEQDCEHYVKSDGRPISAIVVK